MATNPNFTATGNNARVRLTTANTTRDLSTLTNASLLISAEATGTRIETIDFNHVSASQTQASIVAVGRVFICTDALGANPRLKKEIALPAVTPSASAIGQSQTITFSPPLVLENGEHLWVSISATQTSGAYDVVVGAGDF